MIRGENETDEIILDEVFNNFAAARTSVGYRLRIDGRPHRIIGQELRVSSEEDGPAIVLEATVSGRVSLQKEGTDVELDYLIRGVELPGFRGELRRPEASYNGTRIIAASPSSWLAEDAVFNEEATYFHWSGGEVLLDIMTRIDRHIRTHFPPVTNYNFNRTREEAYQPNTNLSEAVGDVEEEMGMLLRDDVRGWARGFMAEHMDDPGQPVASWTVGKEIPREDFQLALTEDLKYFDVAVFRTTSAGKFEELARSRVRHRYGKTPPACMTMWIETTDVDTQAIQRASATAMNTASAISQRPWTVSFPTIMLDARIERCVDTVEVIEDDGEKKRTFHFRILSHEHTPHGETKASYTGAGMLVGEEESSA